MADHAFVGEGLEIDDALPEIAPVEQDGMRFILPVWMSVSSSKNSSNVPKPPGNTASARARKVKCILRSAK